MSSNIVPGAVILLTFQLVGEVAARALSLPLPGPVLGMIALVGSLIALPRLLAVVAPVADALLGHLSLLFVPAGVGVIAHLTLLRDQGLAVVLALTVSTALAIVVGAWAFALTARLMGSRDD
ncbi:CidA/LrgA family protein [Paracoccus sp. p4-l81]|uniref:CidA/LrgA family protein n=1 Tax=Paracoccus sp. p4-l81 TaxID=3342806 RepID=UPI0035B94297